MFKTVLQNRFLANIVTLISGTVVAQALPILLSPWISRIYSPEDFATLALILPIISIGALISTLRLDVAIVIPKTDHEALNVLISAAILNIFITGISAIAVGIIILSGLSSVFSPSIHSQLLWVVPVGIFSVGAYQILNYWSTRCKTYKNNAISKIAQSTTTLIFSIVIGYLVHGPEGLILGFVIGYVFGSLILIYRLRGIIHKDIIQAYNKQTFRSIIKKYRNFVYINTPHAILDIIVDQGIIYLMKVYFTEKILGGFAFAYRYTRAPLSIITSAISQVFYEQASKLVANNQDIRPLMFKIQKNLFYIGIVPFLIIFIFTPQLFAFVFSEEYRQAGEIVRYLLPWIFINYLVSPISTITLILNKQKQALLITIIDFFARFSAILLGGIFFDYTFSFILISIFCSIILIYTTIWFYRIAKTHSSAYNKTYSMTHKIKESIFYRIARVIHKLTRPRMIGRQRNFQGKKVIDSSIGNTTFIDFPENLHFGNNTYIGHHNFIEASNGIEIGDGCQITDFISITTHSSHISIRFYGNKFDRNTNKVGYITGKISIGKFTFIGPHSTIMPGTSIGKGSIIAAYSYVKGEFPDYAIISGNPAKIIGDTRDMDKKYLENHPEIKSYYDSWSNE